MKKEDVYNDLQSIKDSFIAGTDGSYPASLDYAINLFKPELRLIDSRELLGRLLMAQGDAITYDFAQGIGEAIQIVAGMEVTNETGLN